MALIFLQKRVQHLQRFPGFAKPHPVLYGRISKLQLIGGLQFSPQGPPKGNNQQKGLGLLLVSDHLLLGHPLLCPNPWCKIRWNSPEKPWLRSALLIYSLATLSLADCGIMPGGEHLIMLRVSPLKVLGPRPGFFSIFGGCRSAVKSLRFEFWCPSPPRLPYPQSCLSFSGQIESRKLIIRKP